VRIIIPKIVSDLLLEPYVEKGREVRVSVMLEPFIVDTTQGTKRGEVGDYLIVGAAGNMDVCRKEVFDILYVKKASRGSD
jgi:hypothetical protein